MLHDISINATTAFDSHVNDGTIDIMSRPDLLEVNGGNWIIGINHELRLWCDVPHNDPNYMDDDVETFIDNVFSTEAIESLRDWNQRSWGVISEKLHETDESWSIALANRIEGGK